MTQRIDWETAGKAAGEAEKNVRPGIKATRPKNWQPGQRWAPGILPERGEPTSLARSHESTRKFNRDRAIGKKLDALLGVEEDE